MSEPDLPEVFQAELDEATLAKLFEDLAAHATVLEIREKSAARSRGEATEALDLERARARLEAGEVRAIQIRYRHEGALWMDTLMRGPTLVRLVRTRVPVDE